MQRTRFDPRMLAIVAVMTAVVFVLTLVIQIPTPAKGYIHLGDTGVFFSAFAFGPMGWCDRWRTGHRPGRCSSGISPVGDLFLSDPRGPGPGGWLDLPQVAHHRGPDLRRHHRRRDRRRRLSLCRHDPFGCGSRARRGAVEYHPGHGRRCGSDSALPRRPAGLPTYHPSGSPTLNETGTILRLEPASGGSISPGLPAEQARCGFVTVVICP